MIAHLPFFYKPYFDEDNIRACHNDVWPKMDLNVKKKGNFFLAKKAKKLHVEWIFLECSSLMYL